MRLRQAGRLSSTPTAMGRPDASSSSVWGLLTSSTPTRCAQPLRLSRRRPNGSAALRLVARRLSWPSHVEQARALVDGLLLGTYDPGRWKTGASADPPFERLVLVGGEEGLIEPAERAATVATAATALATSPTRARTSSHPSGWPTEHSELASEHANLTAEALGPDEFGALGMGAFGGVAQGSHNPARLIVLRYDPPSPKSATSSSGSSARRSRSTRAASRSSPRSTWRT